jgi:hypothetical protein
MRRFRGRIDATLRSPGRPRESGGSRARKRSKTTRKIAS